ncbi:MAG: VCBS repeat-containing protein [Bacteroidetes bacterium]|nr:VCBS repeat-containing protein [Bacteroidota bacterium]MBU1678231.1 VCBS repeat-containing protein [Bacteroidota bacterium]
MKRWNDGKQGLALLRKIKFILISIFICTTTYSQFRINGFASYNYLSAPPGYSAISVIDFNKDSNPDIILHKKGKKGFYILPGNKDGGYESGIEKFFYYDIDCIQLMNSTKRQDFYLFASRSSKMVGLASFTKYGTLQLLNEINLNSYPSWVTISDLNSGGKNEALVCGGNFEGLMKLREHKYILYKEYILEEGLYESAHVLDLDYDGFKDIAVFDILNNEVALLYNDHFNSWNLQRTIKIFEQINGFRTADFNNDDYTDLILSTSNSFEIFLGDSVSSFENRISLKSDQPILTFDLADYNSDGLLDISFITSDSSKLLIHFNTGLPSLNSTVFASDEKLCDILSITKSDAASVYTLNFDGGVHSIKRYSKNDTEIIFATKTSTDKCGTISIDKNFYFYSVNNDDGNFRLLKSTPKIFNELIYDIKTNGFVKNIKAFDSQQYLIFALVYDDGYTIEFIDATNDLNIKKKIVYSTYSIEDIIINSYNGLSDLSFSMLGNNQNNLTTESIKIEKGLISRKITDLKLSGIQSAVYSPFVASEIIFWSKSDSVLTLNELNLSDGKTELLKSMPLKSADSSAFCKLNITRNPITQQKGVGSIVSIEPLIYFDSYNASAVYSDVINALNAGIDLEQLFSPVIVEGAIPFIFESDSKFKKMFGNYIESVGMYNYFTSVIINKKRFLLYQEPQRNFVTLKEIK